MFDFRKRIKPVLGATGILGFLGFLGLIRGFESFYVFFSFFSFFGFYWIGKLNRDGKNTERILTIKIRVFVLILFILSLIVYPIFKLTIEFRSYLLITCSILFSLLCILSVREGYEKRKRN